MTIESTPSELTVEQFKSILTDSTITKPDDLLLLQTLYSFKNHRGPLRDIIAVTQKRSFKNFNRMYLVERIAEKYPINLTVRSHQEFKYWDVLFDGEKLKDRFDWILKPELVQAMEELGLCGEIRYFPEEISLEDTEQKYTEGLLKTIVVNVFERSPQARAVCVEKWGTICSVCGFDFEKNYGAELGKGYIHVHHLKPLASIGEAYEIDPINDLRPVCPNCHAMLHRKNSVLSIEELKKALDENRS